MKDEDPREMSNEDFERLVDKPSTPESHPERYDSIAPVVFEYIHKIARRICPRLDHEEIAMDLWTKCWQEKRMPTYTQVKNHCLDALRRSKSEEKKNRGHTELNFTYDKIRLIESSELSTDLVDKLMTKAQLTPEEHDAVYRRFYLGLSANSATAFQNATVKLQRAWKEYCNERDEQE